LIISTQVISINRKAERKVLMITENLLKNRGSLQARSQGGLRSQKFGAEKILLPWPAPEKILAKGLTPL